MIKFTTLNLSKLDHKILLLIALMIVAKIIISIGLDLNDPSLSVFDESIYAKFDSGHYLSIAKSGYECFSCYEMFGNQYSTSDWCGNTGWFPGYPFFIKYFGYWIKDFTISAFILNHIFFFSSLIIVFKLLELFDYKNKIGLLALCALCPGFIYYSAIFPLSGVLFFNLMAIYGFVSNNKILIIIGIFGATIFYPTGIFIVIPLIVTTYIQIKISK